jgi:SAM-dependent methyltransferase
LTYGEFPLSSLDALLDLALPHMCHLGNDDDDNDDNDATCVRMLDVGSGCGRLALYAALTRGTREQPWHVHGIEISPMLHDLATVALSRGFQKGTFANVCQQKNNDGPTTATATATATTTTAAAANSIHLHLGAAEEWTQVLQQCNLVFAYSTVFRTSGFSQEWGAMIMDKEWSGLLSQNCPKGCVVVTTDRALDPKDGWHLVDRLNVENREVMGSTGYIHVLEK